MSCVGFCPVCHKEAYKIIEDGDTIKIMQGGRTTLDLNKRSNVNINLSCPSGHQVKLVIKPVEANVGNP